MFPTCGVRRFASVTSKVQRRREAFIRTKHPEYAGNTPASPDDSVRRGKRLGGTFADPSKSPIKLDGSEQFVDLSDKAELEKRFTDRINLAASDPSKLGAILEEYHSALTDMDTAKKPVGEHRAEKIKSITKIDYASARKKVRPTKQVFPTLRDEHDTDSPSMSESACNSLWRSRGAKFVDVHGIFVPSVFSSSLTEYSAAIHRAALFDVSYKKPLRLSGEDALFVIDHFATAKIRRLEVGDMVDSCIVDSKGYVLTCASVARVSDDTYDLILDGNDRESIFRYIAQYVVYSRQSGMDVVLRPVRPSAILSLIGPSAGALLVEALAGLHPESVTIGEESASLPSLAYLQALPAFTTVSVNLSNEQRIGIYRKSDRFLLVLELSPETIEFFVNSLEAVPAGVYALDMVRMERGEPRSGIDIPASQTSPIKASLSHLVDNEKVRQHIVFGHDRLSKEQLKNVSHRRVGLVASKYVYGGCRILSAPHRHPIGEITSCAWSPVANARVCQAMIKPEFAVDGNPVIVTVPLAVPDTIDVSFQKRIVKQGSLQNVFRKLISAQVVSFPLTSSLLMNHHDHDDDLNEDQYDDQNEDE